jgi:hypothetical protein
MISFRIAKHTLTGEDLYEILHDGKVCACIYADQPDGVRIISAHFPDSAPGQPVREIARLDTDGIPSLTVRFDPRPYSPCGQQNREGLT